MEPLERPSALEVAADLFHVLATAVFVFMTIIPSEALAWAQHLSTSQSLVFVANDTLVGEALMSSGAGVARRRASAMASVDQGRVAEGETVTVLAFAYSSAAGQTDGDPQTTADGSRVHAGTIAANWLPFGTRVRIQGLLYTVEDRMNERYDDKYVIDIWQPTAARAVAWGARRVELEIVNLP